ncbi:VOC family protein [Streptacidiphilus fuscans]|uniref:VOC family protein n=1 Tax=Streptacidiphilus fuscans TaxID=2789292 RepID=A0A931FDX7_9ACTN|nr:VOC family protein [Streptacidiphilus fuscans]MBF9071162.1 VOC family protein [Streptacidiphilus fuscans]
MDWTLEVVVLPVADVDRAKVFYSEQVGFHVDVDRRMSPAMRVVQLTPPGSGCSVVVGEGLTRSEPGSYQGLQLCVTDIDAARAHLVERGVGASEVFHFGETGQNPGHGGPWNTFLTFSDPDGNGWIVQQVPKDRTGS